LRNKRIKVSQVQTITTRDPQPVNRDPQLESDISPIPPVASHTLQPRFYIAASMPTVCPKCGHNTRVDQHRYIDPVRRKVVEYRQCIKCGRKLGCGRAMTKTEEEKYCTHVEAVREYQENE